MDSTQEESAARRLAKFFDYLRENNRSSGSIRAMESDFITAINAKNTRSIAKLEKEMRGFVRETFSPRQRSEFATFSGEAVEVFSDKESAKIEVVFSRGKIVSASEFRLLLSFVEAELQGASDMDRIALANKILAGYSSEKK